MTVQYNNWLDETLGKRLRVEENFDVVRRDFKFSTTNITLYYLSSITSSEQVIKIIEGLCASNGDINYLRAASQTTETSYHVAETAVLSGQVALIANGIDEFIMIEARSYPNRGISTPINDHSVYGSQDAFTESILLNVALIRRRIRHPDLRVELIKVGELSRTDVVICYMLNKTDLKVVTHLKEKLQTSKIESLIMPDRAVAALLFKDDFLGTTPVRDSERPDITASTILDGHVAILVDNTPNAMMVPASIVEMFKGVEEYFFPSAFGTFWRLRRHFLIFIAYIFLALWLAVTKDGIETYIFKFPSGDIQTPVIVQFIVVSTILFAIRMAPLHAPGQLIIAAGMIAGILIGDIGTSMGLFSLELVFYSSIAMFAAMSMPTSNTYYLANYIQVVFAVFAIFFGRIGFVVTVGSYLLMLMSVKTFGVPYLFPFIPYNGNKLRQILIRKNLKSGKKIRS